MVGILISKRGLIWIWFSVGLLILSACAGPGKRLDPPRLSLANIQVKEVKGFETVLEIELRIFNTNDVPIEIKGIDCELELGGKHLASGVSDKMTKIPSYGTATVPVVVYSSVLDMVKSALGLPDKEKLEYRIKGRLRIGAGLVPPVIPFDYRGELSLEGITESM